MIMQEKVLEVSKKIGVPTAKVYELLSYLKMNGGVENNNLINYLGVSKNVLNLVKEELGDLLEPTSNITKLSEKGLSLCSHLCSHLLCSHLEGAGVNEDDGFFEFVLDILKLRPTPERDLDQFLATGDTVISRARLMDALRDLDRKKVLFIGDDDFTSLACAKLSKAQVTVLDIDKRILDGISKISQENSLDIEVIEADVKEVLPDNLLNKFDVVFSDPPYTPEGFNLFLSRAVQALDSENLAARIYICFGTSDRSKERALPIFEAIVESGLFIRSIFDGFNRYIGAESIGSASTLIICDVTPKTKALIKEKFNKSIYTND